jgi:hypothetical protein
MRRFPLYDLFWQEFENLVVLLCEKVLGIGTINFSIGADGGRDAKFRGKAQRFPSETNPWEGKMVVQAKHTAKPTANCADADFQRILENEVEQRLKKLINSDDLDYYLLFTNRKLSGNIYANLTEFVDSSLGIESIIIGDERIQLWLREYPEIVKTLRLNDLLLPLQFYPDDLKDIILKFSSVSGQLAKEAEKKGSKLRWMEIEKKNELNRLSKDYFDVMKKESPAFFSSIESFLKDPLNKKYLEAYDNTVFDLQAKISLKRSEYFEFQEIIEDLYDFVFAEFPGLRPKRKLIRVFLHYMYFNCDIGLEE